nr:MAG TPA: hypothetical protein [Caudoviricetes sp.]
MPFLTFGRFGNFGNYNISIRSFVKITNVIHF